MDACPECSQAIRLGVVLVEPRLFAFLVGVIGLAMGIGFELILGTWGMWTQVTNGGGVPLSDLIPLGVGLAVESGLLWWWIWSRPRLRRMALGSRVALPAATWAVSAAFAVWFFRTI